MAAKPRCIRGYLCEAAFWDIGTPEDLARHELAQHPCGVGVRHGAAEESEEPLEAVGPIPQLDEGADEALSEGVAITGQQRGDERLGVDR